MKINIITSTSELDKKVNEFMLADGWTWNLNNPHNIYKGVWVKNKEAMTHDDAIDLYHEQHPAPWWKFWSYR